MNDSPISNRVLVVGEFGTLNGGERSFLAIAPELINRGWDFSAAMPCSSELSDSESGFGAATQSLSFDVYDWNVRPLGIRKELPTIRKELADIIRKSKPAIVHFNSLSTCRIGGPVTKELGIPSLGYLRDIMKVSKAAISDINCVDQIIAVSQATKDWHIAQGLEEKRTLVVYNGVDNEIFCPQTVPKHGPKIREELSIPQDSKILLYVGQIGMRKGIDILIESFLRLAKNHDGIHLVVIGQRHSQKEEAIEYESDLHQLVEDSNFKERVHFLGRRSDVSDIMRASDILLHPARQEPLGRVLLEASASGLAIVTTDVGGSREVLGESGGLVQPHSVDAFSQHVNDLLESPEKIVELGLKLRKRAIRLFTPQKCAEQINVCYRRLIQ